MPKKRRKQIATHTTPEIPFPKVRVEWIDILSDSGWASDKEFDKKSKKDAAEWSVVVKPDAVRLYCPECWATAIDTINKVRAEK